MLSLFKKHKHLTPQYYKINTSVWVIKILKIQNMSCECDQFCQFMCPYNPAQWDVFYPKRPGLPPGYFRVKR